MYLHCHSQYSLRYGTIPEQELVDLALENGYEFVGLTDINTSAACLSFIQYCQQKDMRAVVGIDCREQNQTYYIGIAQSISGFYQLNRFVSEIQEAKKSFPLYAPKLEAVYFIYPFSRVQLEELTLSADHEFIGVSVNDLNRLRFSRLIEQPDRLVFASPVSFRSKKEFNTHRLLRAIDNNTLLSKLDPSEQGNLGDQMLRSEALYTLLHGFDFLVANTRRLAQSCKVAYDFDPALPSENLGCYGTTKQEDFEVLKSLCERGIAYRYPKNKPHTLRERLEKELTLIEKKDFTSYFLINYDLTKEARRRGFFYVGRGSGANSLVAYLLRITDVDPIELDLYFERFINEHRSSPPDFDIDFSWRDRDQMLRYLFGRYPNVCLLGAYVTFQKRAVIREIGKVFGLSKEEIDGLVEQTKPLAPTDEKEQLHRLVLRYASYIQGLPNHFSIHAGGVLITQKPIEYYCSTFLPPKGMRTAHLDMHIAEELRIHKFDILSQRGLSKIADAVTLVKKNRGITLDIQQIESFKKDEKINQLLANGDCMGCFYIESPAMRMLLQKLQVNNYLSLVAASSIIRPGVSQSGMMNEYILRHRSPKRVKEQAHPVLLEIMPETYGVMVYQEDVIKVAHYFGGLSLADADVLRRAMSGKSRSKSAFERIRDQFFINGTAKGYTPEEVSEIWRQIESFAGYAFAKGHSASYAVESYQSLYLRAYYPIEYLAAVLNNGGGFYASEFYLKEAVRLGAQLHLPCVNNSDSLCVLKGTILYLGFSYLKELEQKTIDAIIAVRQHKPFDSLSDFIDRVPIGSNQVELLIRVGAFTFTRQNKHELLWQALRQKNSTPYSYLPKLFNTEKKTTQISHLTEDPIETTYELWELLGFPLSNTFELLKSPIKTPLITVTDFSNYLGKEITLLGYLVTIKNTKTKMGKTMQFATFLDCCGNVFDTTSFPEIAQQYPIRSGGIYHIHGTVVTEYAFKSIEVKRLERCEYIAKD